MLRLELEDEEVSFIISLMRERQRKLSLLCNVSLAEITLQRELMTRITLKISVEEKKGRNGYS
jgi:hypothetical protein